jgi:TetR/AcrR family transcriptional regulator, transcriptional repressor for nem operon
MTDSTRATATAPLTRPGKRERLVAAATTLLHEQGVERTTLADIAAAADVPLGNVYYYFKTKDDVIAAVVDTHAEQIRTTLALIDSRHRSPRSRLKALVREFTAQSETVARFGCPLGSLCSELDKRSVPAAGGQAKLMRLPIDWATSQFRALGARDPNDLAIHLMAVYEGSALLASTMRDPEVLTAAGRRLNRWIDTL